MKYNKKAFTLIELLVVVLIIGILSAIALPQYQKAVIKSRVAGLKPLVAAIKNAEEVYYLANNTYTTDASLLDIGIPCDTTNDPSIFTCGDSIMVDLISGASSNEAASVNIYYCPGKVSPWAECATTHRDFIYKTWLNHSIHPNTSTCQALTDLGTKLCKILD